jgi:hypothetical protein
VKEVLVVEKVNPVRGGIPLLTDDEQYASILACFLKIDISYKLAEEESF